MDENDKTLENSIESTINMSEDEIEKLLLQSAESGKNADMPLEDADLTSLLADLETEEGDLQEISSLLTRADNNEAVDNEIMSLLKSQDEPGQTAYDAMDLFSGEEVVSKKGFWSKVRNLFKRKHVERDAESEIKEKEEKGKTDKKKKEKKKNKKEKEEKKAAGTDEAVELTVENASKDSMNDALALLAGGIDADGVVSEKKQGDHKKKKNRTESAIVDEEPEIKEKKKKYKKKKDKDKKDKKEKKEVKEKEIREKVKEKPTIADAIMELEEEQEELPNTKKIVMVFAASILIMLGFLVVNFYFTRYTSKHLAEEAYNQEDYLECYQLFYGQKLNDSQAAMFYRSEIILKSDIFWTDYNGFVKEDRWLEGLDELTQYVHDYPELCDYATMWNCMDVVADTHQKVQAILTEDFGTNEQEIAMIAQLESDVDYTRALMRIVEEKKRKDSIYEKYPDMLPEEEDKMLQSN